MRRYHKSNQFRKCWAFINTIIVCNPRIKKGSAVNAHVLWIPTSICFSLWLWVLIAAENSPVQQLKYATSRIRQHHGTESQQSWEQPKPHRKKETTTTIKTTGVSFYWLYCIIFVQHPSHESCVSSYWCRPINCMYMINLTIRGIMR